MPLKKVVKIQRKREREEEKNRGATNSWKAVNKMVLSTGLATVILNVNRLNSPIRRHRMAEWIKNKTHLYAAMRGSLQI